MPNIATVLKGEISRIARKEVRLVTEGLKKQSVQHRSHIAALRRQVVALEKLLRKRLNGKREAPDGTAPDEESAREAGMCTGSHPMCSESTWSARRSLALGHSRKWITPL
jgi:hypothetical protein